MIYFLSLQKKKLIKIWYLDFKLKTLFDKFITLEAFILKKTEI